VTKAPGRVRRLLVSLLAFIIFYSGAIRLLNAFVNRYERLPRDSRPAGSPSLKKRRSNSFLTLTYHRVGGGDDPFLPARPTPVFKRQMEYLAANYRVASLDDATEAMLRGDLEDNTVVVTFDDGYRDNYLNAYPILRELRLPATIFLVTSVIGSGKILWHDRVFRAFNRTRATRLAEFGPRPVSFEMATPRERTVVREAVLGVLKAMGPEERLSWIDRLIDRLEVEDPPHAPGLMLDWGEVKEMYENGISFGSHTVSHAILSRLTPEQAGEEISRSKQEIEQQLRAPIRAFAYPNGKRGDFTAANKELLVEAGFRCAATTIPGTNGLDSSSGGRDLLELKRNGISATLMPVFAMRLNLCQLA
jgi:peptidoglycan/xylan/chitin deacetylase (PgdA/CDA1 family)